jgi:hypothetical protein
MPYIHQPFAEVIDYRNPAIDTGIIVTAAVAIIAAILICQLIINVWHTYLRSWTKRSAAKLQRILADLRSLPHTDEESFQALELMLQGIVLCVLGQIFPILSLFGVVPLYYGARKLGWVLLGSRRQKPDGLGK